MAKNHKLKPALLTKDCQVIKKKKSFAFVISSDNVELVLESSAIPESGTASVRARPTVKHYTVSISVTTHIL